MGSFFRTADAMGIEKIYLAGYTAQPPRREISKTAIGAEDWIDWEYKEDPIQAINDLKEDGWKVVGLELEEGAQKIADYSPTEKICLVLGHEVTGVPEEIIKLCDDVVYIPMHGKKESLNVSVALGIALDRLRN
ncbi:MAG: TrmH family RNA methyltransferase [Candidatus Peribacter sp.]|nr:TrmH family RNA methyltransferase [Candidatus Peribacter sp.]MBT4392441.1 TrmH family RNA methyltransferase [Candidatus Peribacter sp.]MBT4601229.1 TrmH family RNA methyltransferase [Candidatus Peribacter sp.]MBT5149278.1 TrmH family RNA methyltransferase [Candidatus Peribacter sp.]MBT5938236.1 TrmH family RNA methyltransferase [Candidatus Peribacter sp.]